MHVGKLDKVADVMVRLGERIDSYSKRMGGSVTTKGAVTKSDAEDVGLWKYNKRSGYWDLARKCAEDTKDKWLKIFQSDEPSEHFKLSKNRPSNNPTK